ncbi:MAG: transposase, partial [Raoultibacter sp.]
DRQVKLPKLGLVKARISRPFEGRILSATVKQVPSGKYFVAICCTEVPHPPIKYATIEMLGIDAGIHDIATCSTGKHVQNPRNFAKSEKKLARE